MTSVSTPSSSTSPEGKIPSRPKSHSLPSALRSATKNCSTAGASRDKTAEFADWFLGQIDGSRSIGEIGKLLRARYGNLIADHEVIAFFRQLREDAIVTFM